MEVSGFLLWKGTITVDAPSGIRAEAALAAARFHIATTHAVMMAGG